jgi:hypothetical protein
MTYRATKSELKEVFNLFCQAIRKRVAETWNDTGALTLDYAKEYGGYVIQEIINGRGAIEMPLGHERLTATELVERMRFFLRWIEQKNTNSRSKFLKEATQCGTNQHPNSFPSSQDYTRPKTSH